MGIRSLYLQSYVTIMMIKTKMNSSTTKLPSTTTPDFQIILFCLLSCFIFVTAQPTLTAICSPVYGNYTENSPFKINLHKFLSSLTSSNTKIDYGYFKFSAGNALDIFHGYGLCQPDLSVIDCHSCLKDAATDIIKVCPNQKDAFGENNKCIIRYSPHYILGKLEVRPWIQSYDQVFNVNRTWFNQTVSSMLHKLQKEAAAGDSRYKFAAGEANVTDSLTVYALVQCAPDLEEFDCNFCIGKVMDLGLTYFYGVQFTMFLPVCNIRYQTYQFYNASYLTSLKLALSPAPAPSPLPTSATISTKERGSKKARNVIIIIIVTITMFLVLLTTLFGYCYYTRRRTQGRNKVETGTIIRTPESLQMDFATIKTATDNFSDANKLGRGGFGTVYKGKLPNGQEIAVKRLAQNSGQGEEEFKNEALLVGRLQHRNLVRFLGFCLEDKERLLIYEFLPNKSLDCFLFDPIRRVQLEWLTRYNIIKGIARGLLYLHEDSRLLVVHRDLKAGNILLDAEMNPKISDFGMARLFGTEQSRANASKICGTYGYMPPEYVLRGQYSIKSDVYSFGVLLLEIISSKKISSFFNSETGETLLSFAWRNWLEGTTLKVVDSTMSSVNTSEVERCINIALLCVQETIAHRPIMSSIVHMLDGSTVALPVPSRPAFVLQSVVDSSDHSSKAIPFQCMTQLVECTNDVSITELHPR